MKVVSFFSQSLLSCVLLNDFSVSLMIEFSLRMHLIIHIYKEAGTLCNQPSHCSLSAAAHHWSFSSTMFPCFYAAQKRNSRWYCPREKQHLKQIHKVARGNVHGNHRHPHTQAQGNTAEDTVGTLGIIDWSPKLNVISRTGVEERKTSIILIFSWLMRLKGTKARVKENWHSWSLSKLA